MKWNSNWSDIPMTSEGFSGTLVSLTGATGGAAGPCTFFSSGIWGGAFPFIREFVWN